MGNCGIKSARLLLYLGILLLAFNSQLVAQSARARIVGTVKDPQGAVVAGANIIVTNVATGVQAKAQSDQQGSYQILELPIGSYKVKAEHNGFSSVETVAYTLEINQVQRIDITMRLGSRSETVEVTGDAGRFLLVSSGFTLSIYSYPR